MEPRLEPARPEQAAALLRALSEEMQALYGEDGSERFREPCYFVVARLEARPVGCAGLVEYDAETLEVKRMYVAPESRGHGLGRLLLAALEDWARGRGTRRLVLETGTRQPGALALYLRAGYHAIEPYGPFVGNPDSLCFEKALR